MPGLVARARSRSTTDGLRGLPRPWRLQEHRRRRPVARDNSGLSLTTVSSLALDPAQAADRLCKRRAVRTLQRASDGGATGRPSRHDSRGSTSSLSTHTTPKRSRCGAQGTRGVRSHEPAAPGNPQARLGRKEGVGLAISGDKAYAGTSRGVFSSADGGKRWAPLPSPGTNYVEALAIAADDPDVVYAGSGGTKTRGLYKSTDGGRAGSASPRRPEPRTSLRSRSIPAPDRPSTSAPPEGASLRAPTEAQLAPASTGLPRHHDERNDCHGTGQVMDGDSGRHRVAVDPVHPATLYAATSGSGIFRSTDAGRTWRPFNAGLDVLDIASLAIDARGGRLYAGTAAAASSRSASASSSPSDGFDGRGRNRRSNGSTTWR